METSWKFIVEENENEYYCIICGCDVIGTTHNVKQHFHGKQHASSLDKYGRNISPDVSHNRYYCDLCECTVAGYENVRNHVIGKRHKDFLEESEDESDTSEESEDESDTSYDPMESADFVLCTDSGTEEFKCFLCDKKFTGRGNANYHLYDCNHRETFRIYGSKISSSETGWYYCELCDCHISSWKNVYAHLNGLRHEDNV